MENISKFVQDGQIDLPPGFRFHPTDEELITHYLSKKVLDSCFSTNAIGEVDMNKVEPWDMPLRAKLEGKEWYFFCVRDKKYPTGLRTNRATTAGYWKATGKDKEIFQGKSLVGMKKTLVFYKGRAPRGEKTNWVIHEYRLDGKLPLQNLPEIAKNEWVLCRVFHKSFEEKKIHISGLVEMNLTGNGYHPVLPPLMDSSAYSDSKTELCVSESIHVHCFSNPIENHKDQDATMDCFNNSLYPASSNSSEIFLPRFLPPNMCPSNHAVSWQGNLPSNDAFLQDQVILKGLLQNNDLTVRQSLRADKHMLCASQETGFSIDMNTEVSSVERGRRLHEDHEAPSTSAEPALHIDCLWNY